MWVSVRIRPIIAAEINSHSALWREICDPAIARDRIPSNNFPRAMFRPDDMRHPTFSYDNNPLKSNKLT